MRLSEDSLDKINTILANSFMEEFPEEDETNFDEIIEQVLGELEEENQE